MFIMVLSMKTVLKIEFPQVYVYEPGCGSIGIEISSKFDFLFAVKTKKQMS